MKTKVDDSKEPKYYKWSSLSDHLKSKVPETSSIGSIIQITGTVFAEISEQGISFYTTMYKYKGINKSYMTLSDLT